MSCNEATEAAVAEDYYAVPVYGPILFSPEKLMPKLIHYVNLMNMDLMRLKEVYFEPDGIFHVVCTVLPRYEQALYRLPCCYPVTYADDEDMQIVLLAMSRASN